MMFAVGQKIKLLDYSRYEYPRYKGQTAVITTFLSKKSTFNCEIRWSDGNYSYVMFDNILILSKFNLGDVVTVGEKIILVDGHYAFDESQAQLISRKKLI